MKGRKTGGGSRKGKPNRHTAALKDMITQALESAGGVEYLQRQAEKNPAAFLSLLGKTLPLQVAGDRENPVAVDMAITMTPAEAYARAIKP